MALADPTVTIYFDSVFDDPLVFVLNDPVQGELDGAFVLGGDLPVDITSYVRSYQSDRGRVRQLDDIVAGTCRLVLNNHTRDFDPLNAAGPFFGAVLPTKRVTIAVEGTAVFDGLIDDWSFEWTVDGQALAIVDIVDVLGKLARIDFDEWTTTASQTAGPRITSSLDRAEVDFGANRDLDTGVSILQGDLVTWGSNVLNYLQLVSRTDLGRLFASRENVLTFRDRHAVLNPTPTVTFADAQPSYLRLDGSANTFASCPDIAAFAGATTLTVEVECALDNWQNATEQGFASHMQSPSNRSWRFTTGLTGNRQFLITSSTLSAATPSYQTGTLGYAAGSRRWVGFDWYADLAGSSSTQFQSSDDGVTWTDVGSPDTDSTLPSGLMNSTTIVAIGAALTTPPSSGSLLATGNFYRARIYADGVLVASPDFRFLSTDTTTVQDEQGNTWTLNGNAEIQADVTADPTIPYTVIGTSYGSEFLFNRVGVDREGGNLQTAIDATSQATYGVHTLSLTGLLLNSDTQADAMADFLVSIYKDPEFHISQVQVVVSALSVAERQSVLELEIADTVTVKFTPSDVGAQFSEIGVIEGVSHSHDVQGLHIVTFALGAVDNRAVFVLDDATFGVLDGTSVLAL